MLPQNFQIFKNKFKKEGSQQPDYKISSKNDKGVFEEIGAGWSKTMTNGEKYISCKLSTNPAPTGLTEAEKENIRLIREKAIRDAEEANQRMETQFATDF